MARPITDITVELNVEFISIEEEDIDDWNAGVSFLVQLLREEKKIVEAESERVECDHPDHAICDVVIGVDALVEDGVFQT